MEPEEFLQAQQARLTDMLRPYQREVNRQQGIADFVNRCLRSASRDDFFQLYELLNSRTASEVEAEPGWEDAKEVFDQLRADATQKVERYQLRFLEDFTRLVDEAGLPLENDFPRLRLLKGIELEVVFTEKRTLLNGRPLKTVDPTRLIRAIVACSATCMTALSTRKASSMVSSPYTRRSIRPPAGVTAIPRQSRRFIWNIRCRCNRVASFRIWPRVSFAATTPTNSPWISGGISAPALPRRRMATFYV